MRMLPEYRDGMGGHDAFELPTVQAIASACEELEDLAHCGIIDEGELRADIRVDLHPNGILQTVGYELVADSAWDTSNDSEDTKGTISYPTAALEVTAQYFEASDVRRVDARLLLGGFIVPKDKPQGLSVGMAYHYQLNLGPKTPAGNHQGDALRVYAADIVPFAEHDGLESALVRRAEDATPEPKLYDFATAGQVGALFNMAQKLVANRESPQHGKKLL